MVGKLRLSKKDPASHTAMGQQYFAEAGAGIIKFKEIFNIKSSPGWKALSSRTRSVGRCFDTIKIRYQYVTQILCTSRPFAVFFTQLT